ncbi:MAG: leucyl/phenylalanyl-tRNA--protein transferase [Pseudomonadota bacterium]
MPDPDITPELLLRAYMAGVFPMAETRGDADIFWVDPRRRGVFPIGRFHSSRSLRRTLRSDTFRPTIDRAFSAVVAACADREETWINARIEALYAQLHEAGHAHSLEVWEGEQLVGGVYGVAMGGAFFGESMFSHRSDASKVALAFLMDRLQQGGFTLFDTQFLTPHLESLGAVEISRAAYHKQLRKAVAVTADFNAPETPNAQELVQRISQTS